MPRFARASSVAKDVLTKARGGALRLVAEALPSSVVFQHGPRTSRKIALTFDDGPGPMTKEYVDVLEKAGARGTFFVIGNRCAEYADVLADTARRGHDVAGHGWSHTPFTQLKSRDLEGELFKTSAVLPALGGRARLVRPPFGRMTPRSLLGSFRAGYASAMWSFDPLDSQAQNADDVVRAVDPRKLRGGDIVLLHEEHRATLDALPEVIRRLQDADFELVTVTELVPL